MWRPHSTPLLPVDLPTSWNVDPALALGFNQKPALIRYWDTDDLSGFTCPPSGVNSDILSFEISPLARGSMSALGH